MGSLWTYKCTIPDRSHTIVGLRSEDRFKSSVAERSESLGNIDDRNMKLTLLLLLICEAVQTLSTESEPQGVNVRVRNSAAFRLGLAASNTFRCQLVAASVVLKPPTAFSPFSTTYRRYSRSSS